MISFDIETQPRPDEELIELLPPLDESDFEVGDFDESAVKVGNMKDPKKIAEKIEKAREDHRKKKESAGQRLEDAKEKQFAEFRGRAGLDAALSQVLAIGFYGKGFRCLSTDSLGEAEVLNRFWRHSAKAANQGRPMVGVNILEFDIPYLIRRSWIQGVEIPHQLVWDLDTKWPKFSDIFVDLGKRWLAGVHPSRAKWGFATLAAAFGTDGKPSDGVTGANFHEMWRTDRDAALAYLESDVKQPLVWAKAMGL